MLLLLLSRFSHDRLCVNPETEAHQAPTSVGFSRQEHWSGLPFPSPTHESEDEAGQQLCSKFNDCDGHRFRSLLGPEIKLPTSTGSSKKQERSRKTSTSALLITVCGFIQVACQGFLVREACVHVLVGGAVFLLSGVQ